MRQIEVIVEYTGKNLSAYIEGAPIITVGNDLKEIKKNIKEAIELYLDSNPNPCEMLTGDFELKFRIDTPTKNELHTLDDIKTKYYGEVGTLERDRIENELAALRGKMHRCNKDGMRHFDDEMLAGLHTASELLDSKYGAVGTESRAEFEREAHSYYLDMVENRHNRRDNTQID